MLYMPDLALETQAFIRTVYGILLFILFTIILPFSKVYFTSERYGGCLQPPSWCERFLSPLTYRFLMVLWMGSVASLALGIAPLLFSLINLLLCRLFFVQMRWISSLRGMGAPGFMSYWLAAAVFLLEYATYCGDAGGKLRSLVVLTLQVDFGVIMIDAGINKIMHGYSRNVGMDYGMANPAWGYWSDFFKKIPPNNFFFRFLNHSAYFFEILGGVLMLIPPTRWLGGAIICASFLFVKMVIRLGVLCDMLMLITVLYTQRGGWFHQLLLSFLPPVPSEIMGRYAVPLWVNQILTVCLWSYIVLLPLSKLGLYYNFYLKKRLPSFLQKVLEVFTINFGIILWRVFTIELIDLFIRIYFEDKTTGERTPYSRFGRWKWGENNRFLWVGESIMSLILFNTLRYFPQTDLFRKRLLCYAKTMPCPNNSIVVFEYVVMIPSEKGYDYIPGREFRVDLSKGSIEEVTLNETALHLHQKRTGSPVRASERPGSYAPA